MKGCFFLQRNFAKVGHAMAIDLKKRYGLKECCAFVFTRQSYDFLKTQTDVNYTNLLLEEDVHDKYKQEEVNLDYLKNMEKEYGIPNLWPYVLIDRIVMQGQLLREYPYDRPQYSHEEILKIFQATAKEIISFLERERPDFIFFSVVGTIGSYLLYQIAKKKGIQIFFGETSRFPDSYMLTDDYSCFHWTEERWQKFQNQIERPDEKKIGQAKKIIADFVQEPKPYLAEASPTQQPIFRRRQFKFASPSQWKKTIYWAWRTWYDYFSGSHRRDYSTIKPWFHFWDRCQRKLRVLVGYEDLYDEPKKNEDFAFYPLSFEPEMFLLLYAPFATDQLYLIKQLARSLPLYYKLYVKEHPSMVGYRTRKFYRELKKIPNVKLIHPKTISFDLMRRAKLVATVTGTAGWEALFFKKPVITFGYNFFNKLSMVRYCQNTRELPYLVKEQLENYRYQETEFVNFIAALLYDTVPVNMDQLWIHETELNKIVAGVGPLTDLIAQKLNLPL